MKTTHLALCQDCRPLLPTPFLNEDERDLWVEKHVEGTGHAVLILEERRP